MSNELLQQVKNEVAKRYNKKANVPYESWEEMEQVLTGGLTNSISNLLYRFDEVATLYHERASQSQQPVSMDDIEAEAGNYSTSAYTPILESARLNKEYYRDIEISHFSFVAGAYWLLSRLPSPQGEIGMTVNASDVKPEFKDLEEPIGNFILNHKTVKGKMGLDGMYYHYADVCTLLNHYKKKLSTPQASPWVKDEIKIDYSDVCPLTKRPFFMVIEDQNLYPVATYGGPFDSYTIPEKIDYGTDSEDDDEYIVHRYDHDIGGWVDDEAIYLEDFPEQNIEDFKDYLKSISAPVSEPKRD